MAPKKTVFLSDIHIGPRIYPAEWFKKDDRKKVDHVAPLCAFLNWLAEQDKEVKDLVLLGDIFENWMCPVGQVPPTIAEILQTPANKPIWTALQRCMRKLTNVFYVPGNHDMATTQEDLDLLVGTASGGKRIQLIPAYMDGLLLAEHGHNYAMFNAPDPVHEPVEGLPLGYFITRTLASTDKNHEGPEAIGCYIEQAFEAMGGSQTLSETVLSAVMDLAGLKDSTVVKMAGGRPDITLGEVKTKYRDLWDCWAAKGGMEAFNAVRAEMGGLEGAAEKLQKRFKVIVFGHTHEANLRYYPRQHKYDASWPVTHLYANADHWCTGKPRYVEAENQSGGGYVVRLVGVTYEKNKLKLEHLDEAAILPK